MDKHNLEGIDHPSEKKDDWKKFQKKYLVSKQNSKHEKQVILLMK